LAGCAIIHAQIKARLLRFDPSQYQWPSAFGARWPEIIDKLKIKRICHGLRQHLTGGIASQFRRAK
jgi:hypothetical protein